jgi:hypothetical protein
MKPLIIRDTKTNNLQISEDTGFDDKPIAVLLYTPTMTDTSEHFHIELQRAHAEALIQWLRAYLERSSS